MIVLVDDSATNLKIYSKLAEGVDPSVGVRTFNNPTQAIEWIRVNDPDIVITDYSMPKMNGADFTRQIRALPHCVDVPVIVVTAYADRDFRIEALEAGATDFMLSPIDHAEFQPRVRNLLRLSAHQRMFRERARTLENELKESEHLRDQILRYSHDQLAQVIDTVPAMISATDLQGRSIFINDYQMKVLGNNSRRPKDKRDAIILERGTIPSSFEEQVCDQNGVVRTFLTSKTPLRSLDCATIGLLTTSIDITERKQSEERILFQAKHDQLTSLPNRYYLNHWLFQEIETDDSPKRPFALYYIDLDRFKYVNDGFGHHFGDSLLQAVSRRLEKVTRQGDLVVRLGGDEFAVLQLGINSIAQAKPLAERINRLMLEPFIIEEREVTTSVSIGITIYPGDGASAQELLQNADLAMYQVKGVGRNGMEFFTNDMRFQAGEATRVRSLLHGALSRNEFVLYYQPQINLHNDSIVGAEALIRWSKGGEDLVSPSAFLRIAEESGIMRPIDEWVLREACRQAKRWLDTLARPIRVSVNLSAQTFRDPNLSQLVMRTLHETALPPKFLDLELTETVLLDEGGITGLEIAKLHELGVRLSIDDFGTGYSSMARLSSLPIDTLKIDRSFVSNLGDSNNKEIVRAIVGLGQILNIEVLAEGIETSDQLEWIREVGCDQVQGYFTGRPMSAEQLRLDMQLETKADLNATREGRLLDRSL